MLSVGFVGPIAANEVVVEEVVVHAVGVEVPSGEIVRIL